MTASNPESQVKDWRRTLRWVGVVLIALGVWNTWPDVYAAIYHKDLRLPDGLLVVIAGICLCYGNLWVARVVAFFSGLYFGAAGLSLLLTLPFVPLGLWWAMAGNPDLRWYGEGLLSVALLGLVGWIYWKTGDPRLPRRWEEEQIGQEPRRRRAWVGLALGLMVAAGGLTAAVQIISGPIAQRARAEGVRRLGPGYRYFISQMTIHYGPHGESVRAELFAYNRRDLKRLSVGWEEKTSSTFPGFNEWLKVRPLHPLFPIAGEEQEQESSGTT